MDNTQQQKTPTNQQNTIVEFPKQTGGSTQPQQPSAGHHKELEPMPSLATTEIMQPVEEHKELEPEVEEAGVEVIHSSPQVTQQAKAAGVSLAKETVPVVQEEKKIKNLMTLQEIHEKIKGSFLFKDTSNPMLWLALLLLKEYQIAEKQKGGEVKHAA